MKKNIILTMLAVVILVIGVFMGRSWSPQLTTASGEAAAKEILYWVAPMDPNYRRDEPGKSPMGMDLVPVYASEAEAGSGIVSINPTLLNNLGVRTAAAERGSLPRR